MMKRNNLFLSLMLSLVATVAQAGLVTSIFKLNRTSDDDENSLLNKTVDVQLTRGYTLYNAHLRHSDQDGAFVCYNEYGSNKTSCMRLEDFNNCLARYNPNAVNPFKQ